MGSLEAKKFSEARTGAADRHDAAKRTHGRFMVRSASTRLLPRGAEERRPGHISIILGSTAGPEANAWPQDHMTVAKAFSDATILASAGLFKKVLAHCAFFMGTYSDWPQRPRTTPAGAEQI